MLEVIDLTGQDIDKVTDLVSLKYEDLFDSLGVFEMWCPITEKNVWMLKDERVINFGDGCGGLITYVHKQRANTGELLLHIKGRMLDGILDGRIIWGTIVANNKPAEIMVGIVDTQCVNPTDASRKINLLEVEPAQPSTDANIEMQMTGGDIVEKISTLSGTYKVGFDVRIDYDSDPVRFIFRTLKGVNRSSSQSENNDIIFSLSNGSIASSEYIRNVQSVRNTALVAGAGEGAERIFATVALAENLSSFQRKEIYVDARDIQLNDSEGVPYTPEQYQALLVERGKQKLAGYGEQVTFSVNLSDNIAYEYGVDYYKGDIVTVFDEEMMVSSDAVVKGIRVEYDGQKDTIVRKLIIGSLQPKMSDYVSKTVSSQVSAQIAQLPQSSGVSAEKILADLLELDGAGSGFDADMLDGLHASDFAPVVHTHSFQPADADLVAIGGLPDGATGLLKKVGANTWTLDSSAYITEVNASDVLAKIKTVDGSGSGLDADLLDGYEAAAFLLKAGGTMTGPIVNNVADGADRNILEGTIGSNDYYRFRAGGSNNAGSIELATADDGSEQIILAQYSGVFGTRVGFAILDGNHNFVSSHDFYTHSGQARCWDTWDFYIA